MRLIFALLLCGLSACPADVTVLRYRASPTSIATTTVDHRRSTLPLPARGEATGAVLADGFPVWVVHHEDGTVSVISAVAPPRPKAPSSYTRDDVAAQVDRSLVAWIPGVRLFKAGGILFDERGRALGYSDFDGCGGDCSRIEDMPLILLDLDSFAITSPPGSVVEIGKLVGGQPHRRAATWLPWRRSSGREADMRAADSPTIPRVAMKDALSIADGHYALVDGETVRSTHAEPALCTPSPTAGTCGKCGSERLPIGGITASDAAHIHRDGMWRDPAEYRRDRRREYVEGEPGTFLVQRQQGSFQIVAGIFRGICSGAW